MRLPMSPTDSMFLLGESRDHPMHVGGLLLLQPPEGHKAIDLRSMFAEALAREEPAGALWRKRPTRSLFTLGQWAWEDDPRFSIDYHVRFNALPAPGTMDDLWELVSRLHASLLDRTRPLWEMHLIEGLADGRYALYVKIHHALADGVGAMRLLRRALTTDPERTGMPAPWAVAGLAVVATDGRSSASLTGRRQSRATGLVRQLPEPVHDPADEVAGGERRRHRQHGQRARAVGHPAGGRGAGDDLDHPLAR